MDLEPEPEPPAPVPEKKGGSGRLRAAPGGSGRLRAAPGGSWRLRLRNTAFKSKIFDSEENIWKLVFWSLPDIS